MTNQEIKDRAPEGATHYSESSIFKSHPYYFKIDGNDAYIWQLGKRFAITIRKFSEYQDLNPL